MEAGPPAFVAQVNGVEYAWVYAIPQSGPRQSVPLPDDDADAESQEN
jgi:hypothetical protein